jgi:hypothetical protein
MAEKHQPSKPSPEAAHNDAEPIGLGIASKSVFADAGVFSNIGKGLRAIYMGLVREPLPPEITGTLKKIGSGRK